MVHWKIPADVLDSISDFAFFEVHKLLWDNLEKSIIKDNKNTSG